MSYTLKGTIKVIGQTETVGNNNFQKRTFVVTEQDGNYPKDIALQFTKDKCSILDNYTVGQSVTVDFNIESNEYNGKYFTNCTAWKISA